MDVKQELIKTVRLEVEGSDLEDVVAYCFDEYADELSPTDIKDALIDTCKDLINAYYEG